MLVLEFEPNRPPPPVVVEGVEPKVKPVELPVPADGFVAPPTV